MVVVFDATSCDEFVIAVYVFAALMIQLSLYDIQIDHLKLPTS